MDFGVGGRLRLRIRIARFLRGNACIGAYRFNAQTTMRTYRAEKAHRVIRGANVRGRFVRRRLLSAGACGVTNVKFLIRSTDAMPSIKQARSRPDR